MTHQDPPSRQQGAAHWVQWREIMELGRLAPTPHNTQWYFIHPLSESVAQIGIDQSIQLPNTDPADQFRYTGLGVFTRHLELAAKACGYTLEVAWREDDAAFPLVVTITGRAKPDTGLVELLQTRQTSRLAYSPTPILQSAVDALQNINDQNNTVSMSSDPHVVQAVLELNNTILFTDLDNPGIGDELDSWIRYTAKSRIVHASGFTPATLGVAAWKLWFIFKLRAISKIGILRKILAKQYFAQNQAGTVGWIYGPLGSPKDQFQAGVLMLNVWMKITEFGYYLQPYGSIITNHDARQQLLRVLGIDEEPGRMVWLAFRVGTSNTPARSPRKSTKEYIR